MDMKKLRKKSKKMGKMLGKVSGGKSMQRLDKKSRGGTGKMSGGERPNADGMTAEKPMSSASKTEKMVKGDSDKKSMKK